jgi:CRP/FNR family transcriptional regulator, cyclic AMP receptor protein
MSLKKSWADAQADRADSVFYIHTGNVKVTVISERGKEAAVAIRGPDEFCGEGAMTGAPLRLETATTMSPCEIIRLSSFFFRAEIQHAFQDT